MGEQRTVVSRGPVFARLGEHTDPVVGHRPCEPTMHHFIDFKSFRSEGIELLRPLTILVGPNGSGKSNALEGIEMLAAVAAGHRLREITDLDREGALNVRGLFTCRGGWGASEAES